MHIAASIKHNHCSVFVAGKMTKSNILGYVAAHPIPEVVRGINSFAKGVLEANPDAVVVLQDLMKFCRAHQTTALPDQRASTLLEGRRDVWIRTSASDATAL